MSRGVQIVIGLVVAAAVVGAIVWAVGGNNNKNSSSQPTNTSNQTSNTSNSNTSQPASPTASEISIQNFSFSPNSTTVKKGTQVTWTNNDSTAHTVTADSGSGPNSQTLQPGNKYSFTFNNAGTFKYHCSIHTEMAGTVTVTE